MRDLEPSVSLTIQLNMPVRVLKIQGVPKIIAAGVPVLPINVALKHRLNNGATLPSLETYAHAAKLYVEFAALLNRSLIGITTEEFSIFKRALQGNPFRAPDGKLVSLSGERGARTANNRLILIDSLITDIETLYQVRFEWRKHHAFEYELIEVLRATGNHRFIKSIGRGQGIKHRTRKVPSLPDDQFIKLLKGAYQEWGDTIPGGDLLNAKDPEAQRGALFYRNSSILLITRYGGARRSEVPLLEFEDIDRQNCWLYLVTKGHGGRHGERLKVPLFPAIYDIIWTYVTRFRPVISGKNAEDSDSVFLSHSPMNYGQPITFETLNAMVRVLRQYLDEPWNKSFTLHMLRHAYSRDLQIHLSDSGVVTGMRHASSRSLDPYRESIEIYAAEIRQALNGNLVNTLSLAGLQL